MADICTGDITAFHIVFSLMRSTGRADVTMADKHLYRVSDVNYYIYNVTNKCLLDFPKCIGRLIPFNCNVLSKYFALFSQRGIKIITIRRTGMIVPLSWHSPTFTPLKYLPPGRQLPSSFPTPTTTSTPPSFTEVQQMYSLRKASLICLHYPVLAQVPLPHRTHPSLPHKSTRPHEGQLISLLSLPDVLVSCSYLITPLTPSQVLINDMAFSV